jgi:hypothetical protein
MIIYGVSDHTVDQFLTAGLTDTDRQITAGSLTLGDWRQIVNINFEYLFLMGTN